MLFKAIIPVKPLSKNALKMPISVGKRARLAKTPAARQYEAEILSHMNKFEAEISHFKHAYSKAMVVHAYYTFYVPEGHFWTKQGYVSKRGGDCSNYVEALQDIVTKELGFDDSQITRVVEEKIPSDRWVISVRYELKSASTIRPYPFCRLEE